MGQSKDSNVTEILKKEKEQFSHKLYINIKSGQKAQVISISDGLVIVRYLRTRHEVHYKLSYFDRKFNPVI